MSIKTFANKATENIFLGENTQAARKAVDKNVWPVAYTKLHLLNSAEKLSVLQETPGMRLEPLKHSMPGFYSVRVNNRYRIIFQWKDGDAYKVSVEDPKHHQP